MREFFMCDYCDRRLRDIVTIRLSFSTFYASCLSVSILSCRIRVGFRRLTSSYLSQVLLDDYCSEREYGKSAKEHSTVYSILIR